MSSTMTASSLSGISLGTNNDRIMHSINSNMNGHTSIINNISTPSPPPRSESMAYPPPNIGRSLLRKVQFYMRQNTRAVGATVAFITFVLVITSDYLHDVRGNVAVGSSLRHRPDAAPLDIRSSSSSSNNQNNRFYPPPPVAAGSSSSLLFTAYRPGYFSVQDSVDVADTGFHFGMVTDLDQLSRVPGSTSKPLFQSHLVTGFLQKNLHPPVSRDQTYTIRFDTSSSSSTAAAAAGDKTTTTNTAGIRHLITGHNEAGRGAEFSELTIFDNRLLTFDDRTGDVFEILNFANGADSYCVPRLVLTEGSGDTDKGMKWEWSTVRNNELYMGSMGKEYTDRKGQVVNVNNLWIAVMNAHGEVRRENWSFAYNAVRQALGATAPGYIIVEAVNWSPALQKWVFLPRRISNDVYDDVLDEKRGGRKLVLMPPDFVTGKPIVVDLQLTSTDPLKGFSSFSFVPNSNDEHLLAIRSVEEDCTGDDLTVCKQRSYLVVLDTLTGEQLSPELKYEKDWKFEGLEFFNPFVKPPWGESE